MKKHIHILVLFMLAFGSISVASAAQLRAYLSHASFYAPGQGPYVETYLSILGKSVQFVRNDKGKFQGTILITMLFKQNDSIKEFRKYELNTAEIDDTSSINNIVFDQQRIALPSGKYVMEFEMADKNSLRPALKVKDKVDVNFDDKNIRISEIELIESFAKATESSKMAKSGYDFIPYQDLFYPQSVNKIAFYSEIYNTAAVLGPETQFVVVSAIQSYETGKPVENCYRIKRETSSIVNVVFSEFDISELPSGNYNLVISVRDKENKELSSQSLFFQRSNPGLAYNVNSLQNVVISNSFVSKLNQIDSLREYIRMCSPIAGTNERTFIFNNLKYTDKETLQQFFLTFWKERNQLDPEGAWMKYYQTVQGVQQEFGSTNKKGYETDRGRVYLQYGPPNQRVREPYTPTTLPYEIWQYYQIGRQTDLKFVFYTTDRSVNDYMLAHSNAIGEIKNVNWQYEIRGTPSPQDTDDKQYNKALEVEQFGEHSGEFYNNPR